MEWQLPNLELIAQGAESRVYACTFLSRPTIIKQRFAKAYRHPVLDARLTQRRLQAECRILQRCARAQLPVPTVYYLDESKYAFFMQKIEGLTLKQTIVRDHDTAHVFASLGSILAQLHDLDVVHGDLTTSNILVGADDQVTLIDFGLAYSSTLTEDKAVDLYVLERAFLATHPTATAKFELVMAAYRSKSKRAGAVLSKLENVRLRGRKRSMIG
jgi:TP53 regulating kinase-like protein